MYQLKVDVGLFNTVKIYRVDVLSISPLSDFCSDKGRTLQTSAQ